MSTTEVRPEFRRRFRSVARQAWTVHVGRGLAWTVLVGVALVAAVAAADYAFELSLAARAGLLAASALAVGVCGVRWVVRPARAWDRTRVAAELEALFPRLGQRLRTATQHGHRPADELARDGVSPGLAAALEVETAEQAKPLPFRAALPVRPALLAGAAAIACVALLAVAVTQAPEWRTAVGRVALASEAYTELTATPSAAVVDEGTDVDVTATVTGRARPDVVLFVREDGASDWNREPMEATGDDFTARLSKLRLTTDFYVVAGPERTAVQRVVVRHALKVLSVRAVVTAPAYTGVAPLTLDSGSFAGIQGGAAKVQFTLDRPPVSATLVVKNPATPTAPPQRIEMAVTNSTISVELPLTGDIEYTVEGRGDDGMPVAPNRHRVRVAADQPPSVTFDTPSEGLEVHTLAEVVVRARARDDFGVARLGVVFQVNNEVERTLILLDVANPHQREAVAEQVLMLEQLVLTQKDCVAYYAFAEDNHPTAPHRATTELRFIDIRPFLRVYKVDDTPDAPDGGPQRELIFLDEVIARQRFNLNQTMRLEARSKVRLDLGAVEKLAAFENKLATQTRDLADFLVGLGVDGAAILAQAEEAMLSAVDSLNGAKFTTAIGQERDALRYLMEARDTTQNALRKLSKPARAQAKTFDRLQRQKLRRQDEKAETLPQIAEELAKLAAEEDEVAGSIAGPNPSATGAGEGEGVTDPKVKPEPVAKGDDDVPMPKKPTKGGGDPAQERQDDIAGRAAAIDKVAATAKGLTGLAKERIADASKATNAAAEALGQGDRPAARKEVDRAREVLRTAAKQVGALAAAEAAQQLAAARDLANEVAAQAAPPEPMAAAGAGGTGEAKTPGLGGAAEQAKSLKDVLEKLAGSGAEADADAARKAGGLLKGEDLAAAIARLEKAGAGDDKGERQDLADRFAALGQKLDQAYRETVAPRLEAIGKLEREANELEQRAGVADDAADWRRVRQQTAEFVERLDAAGLGTLADEGVRTGLATTPTPAARDTFVRGLGAAHTRLVAKLQDFVAGDRFTTGTEAVPPEYKDLVERYLRTLSAGGSK